MPDTPSYTPEVQESIDQNLDTLQKLLPPSGVWLAELNDVVMSWQEDRLTTDEANVAVRRIADRCTGGTSSVTACKEGCSHCCYQAVAVNTWEAERIGRFLQQEPVRFPYSPTPPDIDGMQVKYRGVRCTLLTDSGRCAAYEVRPLACQTYYNVSSYSSLCRVPETEVNTLVPCLDVRILDIADVALNMHTSVYRDIREFFPLNKVCNQSQRS